MEKNTNDKIRYTSFKLFLEKGYEATNIREICKDVGIKPSSLYFYYKSKEELFFSIYDEICFKEINYVKNIMELKDNISPRIKLYTLYKKKIKYYAQDIASQKFIFRYHLYPPKEISSILQERFKFWSRSENEIISDIIMQCIERKELEDQRGVNDYLVEYKKIERFHVIQMIVLNIKVSSKEIDQMWMKFWEGINER